jgi:hypothetical protein
LPVEHITAAVLLAIPVLVCFLVYAVPQLRLRAGSRYVRDPDEVGVPPAVAAWLLQRLSIDGSDVGATLIDLVSRRVLEFGVVDRSTREGWIPVSASATLRHPRGDYVFVLCPDRAVDLLPHEEVLIGMVFLQAGGGKRAVSMACIDGYAAWRRAEYRAALEVFSGAVEESAATLGLGIDPRSASRQDVWAVCVSGFALGGLIGAIVSGALIYLGVGLAAAIALPWLLRRVVTPDDASQSAHRAARGLRRYLRDIGLMDEKVPQSVQVWERYLAYATAFGLAGKVDAAVGRRTSRLGVLCALSLDSPFFSPARAVGDATGFDLLEIPESDGEPAKSSDEWVPSEGPPLFPTRPFSGTHQAGADRRQRDLIPPAEDGEADGEHEWCRSD